MSTLVEDSEPIPLGSYKMVDGTDFARLERKVDKLTEALNRLVIFEERQMNQATDISKSEKDIAFLQGQYQAQERKLDQWINRGIGAWFVATIVVSGAMFYISQFLH